MKFAYAIACSVVVHALLGAGVVVCIRHASGRSVPPELDVSSVEVSFADEEDDSSPLSPVPPAPPPLPPVPDVAEPPPPDGEPLPELPPDPEAPLLPEPSDERLPMDLPEREEEARMKAAERENPAPEPPAPAAAPRQAKIDASARPQQAIRPQYPDGARRRGEQGDVKIALEVDEQGRVAEAKVVGGCGHSELEEAALKAVRKARFKPAQSAGRPVASSASLTITFRLKGL